MSVRQQLKKLFSLRRLWCLLCLPAALLLGAAAHRFPAFAECWARHVYPVLTHPVHGITRLFSFSWMEMLLALLLPAVVAAIAIGTVHIVRSRGQRLFAALRAFLVTPSAAASVLLLLFMTNCGINYGRYTFAEISGLDVRKSTADELQALCTELLTAAGQLREQVQEDENGVMLLSSDLHETGKTAAAAYESLQQTFPTLPAGYGAPKPVHFSTVMSYLNITGIFFPFTMEANINTDAAPFSIPSTMCHELAHLRGYMLEDEANFISFLACRTLDHADFRYSGVMLAFIHSINALGRIDAARVREVYDACPAPGVRRDLNANNAYWKRFETPVADVSTGVNHAYLQANGSPDGVHSYGRMVDLLLAWRRAGKPLLPPDT